MHIELAKKHNLHPLNVGENLMGLGQENLESKNLYYITFH